jgi:hypothetical protein
MVFLFSCPKDGGPLGSAACVGSDGLEHLVYTITGMRREERFKLFSGNAARVHPIDVE